MNIEIENLIINKVYDAALDASLWPDVIQHIVEYTHSKAAIFTALDHLNPHSCFTHQYNLPQASMEAYQDERIQHIDMKLHLPLWQREGVGRALLLDLQYYENHQDKDKAIFMRNV